MAKHILLLLLSTALVAAHPSGPNHKVSRGPFRQTVVLDGKLSAAVAEKIFTPLTNNWHAQIKWLAEEGASVAPGDVVVRFDNSGIASQIESLKNDLQLKYSDLEAKKTTAINTMHDSELKLKTARINLEKAELDVAPPKELFSEQDYQKLILARNKAQKEQELALKDFTKTAKNNDDDIDLLKLEIAKLESDYQRKQASLASLEIRTKTGGVVIYSRFGRETRKVQVGDTLQSTWTVMEIPDLNSLQVRAFANETDLTQLAVGQSAELVLDAYPERSFKGHVTEINGKGETRDQWGTAAWFQLNVSIDGPDLVRMRPGMSIRTVILVREEQDVLLVPVAHARLNNGVYQVTPKDKAPIELTVIGANPFHLAVPLDGPLQEGMELQ